MGKGKVFVSRQTVRFRDLDAMGHVNNATYFTYFEEARKEFCAFLLHYNSPGDFPFILASISCQFRRALELADSPIDVVLRVAEIGRKSFTFTYEIIAPNDPAVVFATGESIQVCYDYQNGKTIEIPTILRTALEPYLVDGSG